MTTLRTTPLNDTALNTSRDNKRDTFDTRLNRH
jgi:hypothetical protein